MYKGTFVFREWALACGHYASAKAEGLIASMRTTDSGYIVFVS